MDESIILTKAEAVKLYGNSIQIKHFQAWGKFTNKNIENAFLKTLDQLFDSVEIIKHGRGYGYKLGKKREEIQERKDGRKDNGKKLAYQYQLHSLLIDYILRNCNNKYYTTLTLSKLLVEIGLITPQVAYSQFNKGKIAFHLQELQKLHADFTYKDFVLVKHFMRVDIRRLKQNLGSILNKLAKKQIIKYKKKPMGCDLEDNHRLLTNEEKKQIKQIENNLLSKFGLKKKDLFFENNETEKYFEELEQLLKYQLALKFAYEAHCIKLENSEDITKQRLNELIEAGELEYGLNDKDIDKLIHMFKYLFSISSMELARTRENKNYESEHEQITFRKDDGTYTILWEKMLKYFDLHYDYYEEDIWDFR
jgi:hypothetical protein